MNAVQLTLDLNEPPTLASETMGALMFLEQHRAMAEHIAALPLILHGCGGGWNDRVPDWMRRELPRARLAHYALTQNEHTACDMDVAAYLTTAALEAPLDAEHTHIYLWVCANAIRDFGAAHGIHLPPPDDAFRRDLERPLNRDEERVLTDLRHRIREAQFKHAVQSGRKAGRHER
jgi:hypothetical protein